MRIKTISLKNFRCYSEKKLDFHGQSTVFIGQNAVGKTSLAEAIYVLGMVKSPRITDDKAMIKEGNNSFFIEGEFESSTLNKYKICFGYNGEKRLIKKNGVSIKKLSDYIGIIDVVWFSANDLNLLSGSPQNRRANFDRIICQISKVYFTALSNYKNFLKERNALLKRLIFENRTTNNVLLEVINQRLVLEGKKIISIRRKIVSKINEILKEEKQKIGNENEDFKIDYLPCVSENEFESKLNDNFEEDLKRGNTCFGPHKDDYIFIINNKNIVYQGSQGQQRNAILTLKMAELNLLYEIKKEYPILILDDVFSELDKERQNKLLLGINKEVQTIITTTSISEIDEEVIKESNIIAMKGDN